MAKAETTSSTTAKEAPAALAVRCPTCWSRPGKWCVGVRDRFKIVTLHAARQLAAEETAR